MIEKDFSNNPVSEGNISDLDKYLSEIIKSTFGGEPATADASAPIVLPDRQDLTVRLVSQHSLERLRDVEADKSLFDNLLWCLLGGLIGFFTNVATSQKVAIGAAGIVFISLLAAAAIGTFAMRLRLSRRLNEARDRVHAKRDTSN
ncbi:MAG TPA: hypothetical protein VFQ44_20715 [Streptosporangiaceae bacterium]|nr:hypothetical protein [Streptosporangiaceae bacterium]